MDKDAVIPYPHEHNKEMGVEVIHVFGADVIVTTTVGSGEIFKAVLQKHKFGVGICKTVTQKKQVMMRLKAFVKLMNLVSLREAPAKSQDMVIYEKKLQKTKEPPPADPPTGKVPPPGQAVSSVGITPIVSAPPSLAGFGASVL